jgi:hypothetical protein
VLKRLKRGLEHGAILMLHDAAEREDFEPTSLEVLADLLDAIEARRLQVRPLSEWMQTTHAGSASLDASGPH